MYASVGPGARALLCSFLGPTRCPTKSGRNTWRSTRVLRVDKGLAAKYNNGAIELFEEHYHFDARRLK